MKFIPEKRFQQNKKFDLSYERHRQDYKDLDDTSNVSAR